MFDANKEYGMRIGVNLLNLRLGVMGGFETFARKIVDYLPACNEEDEIIFIVNRHNESFVPASRIKKVIDWDLSVTNFYRILQALFPLLCNSAEKDIASLKLDVLFFPHQAMFPIRINCPSVLNIADVQHLYFPQYFTWRDHWFRRASYDRAVKTCDQIIAISNFTAACLRERYSVADENIDIVHHGFEPSSSVSKVLPVKLDSPYIYYPAASFKHKGHRVLFESIAQLKHDNEFPYVLVLSGVRDAHWNSLAADIIRLGIVDVVLDFGFIDYSEVVGLYRGADAIVFPTEFEGFGLPVLEAAQYEKKIICSRLDVFNEIGVPQAFQIDFSDPHQLKSALNSNKPYALEKNTITWAESISKIYDVLRKTAARGVKI
jgi:glycosyltransferase involved in cell wall biosynthesis